MDSVMYRMNAGLVNQMMACHWIENGVEIESPETASLKTAEIEQKLQEIRKRKIKFDF